MGTHLQGSKPNQAAVKSRSTKYLRRNLNSFILALCIALLVLTIILYTLHPISRTWLSILIVFDAMLGMFMLYLQIIFYDAPHMARLLTDSPFSLRESLQMFHRKSSPLISANETSHGIVGTPPPTNSKAIQQREKIVEEIYSLLAQPNTSVVALTGIAGVGKSTLAAMVCSHIDNHPGSLFAAKPLWLSIDKDTTLVDLVITIFKSLDRTLPSFDLLTARDCAKLLSQALNSNGETRLVVLDQFDNLLDFQTGYIRSDLEGMSEWFDMFCRQEASGRLLLTCRSMPEEAKTNLGNCVHEYISTGLEDAEGVELLRKQIINASDSELYQVVKYCHGHPQALTTFASIYHRYNPTNITDFFKEALHTRLWAISLARDLLDSLYKEQLNEEQRKLLLAFSVYREPVSLEAALLLTADVPITKVQLAQKVLRRQHLLQVFGDNRYKIHPILIDYVQEKFDESDENSNSKARCSAHLLAAQYYLNQITSDYPSPGQRLEFNYLHPVIEAIWHHSQGEQYQEAYRLMEQENIFSDLNRLNRSDILLELYQLLLPFHKWNPTYLQQTHLYKNLGNIYSDMGDKEKAKEYFEKALSLAPIIGDRKEESRIRNDLGRSYSVLGDKEKAKKLLEHALKLIGEIKDHSEESIILNNLSLVYEDLGYKRKAKEYLEKALSLSRERGNSLEEARILNSLGQVYANLGQKEQARLFLEQAVEIRRMMKDKRGIEITLGNLGWVCTDLGIYEEALSYSKQALVLSKEVKDRWGEGRALSNLGRVYADLGKDEEALKYYEQALSLLKEVKDRWGEGKALNSLVRIYNLLGQQEKAKRYYYEALNVSKEARDRQGEGRALNLNISNLELADYSFHELKELQKPLHHALKLCREVGDQKGEGWTLHNLGRLCLAQGDKNAAMQYFEQALHIRTKAYDTRGIGWTLFNIGILSLEQYRYQSALSSFLKAQKKFIEAQSQDVSKVQLAIDELRKTVGNEQFNTLLKKVESEE